MMVEALMAVSVPGCILMSSSDVRFEPGRVTSAKLRSAGLAYVTVAATACGAPAAFCVNTLMRSP